jgi:hypothetical protein
MPLCDWFSYIEPLFLSPSWFTKNKQLYNWLGPPGFKEQDYLILKCSRKLKTTCPSKNISYPAILLTARYFFTHPSTQVASSKQLLFRTEDAGFFLRSS